MGWGLGTPVRPLQTHLSERVLRFLGLFLVWVVKGLDSEWALGCEPCVLACRPGNLGGQEGPSLPCGPSGGLTDGPQARGSARG